LRPLTDNRIPHAEKRIFMKKLLLHTCCAPCMIYPLERLRQDGFDVSGFFYNPNIHPAPEFNLRRQAVEEYGKGQQVPVAFPEYDPDIFFRTVPESLGFPARCAYCWKLRLSQTARYARENGFTAFTTTLLVSPYQDIEVIKQVGNLAAEEQGVLFYFEDFRPGFRKAHDQAKKAGIYCQKYCGCVYSERERAMAKKKK